TSTNGLSYQDDNGSNNYHGLQMQIQKDAGHGFIGAANFTWAHSLGNELNGSGQTADYTWFTQRNGRLSYGPSPFALRRVFKPENIHDKTRVVSGSALITYVSSIAQSNGIPNPANYGPAATPGQYSQLLYLYAATNYFLNLSVNKEVVFKERLHWGFRMEALN